MVEHSEPISTGSDYTVGKASVRPDFRRWFWITYGFPDAVPRHPQGLQRWQSGRLCQQVRNTVISIGFSYLAKQGARGGKEGEHKSLWIPLYSGWDRWTVISLHGINYRVSRPSHACRFLASFHSLQHHFYTACVGSGRKWIQLQVRASLVLRSALSMFCVMFRWNRWNQKVPIQNTAWRGKGSLGEGGSCSKWCLVAREALQYWLIC